MFLLSKHMSSLDLPDRINGIEKSMKFWVPPIDLIVSNVHD